jgi:hypothetical protein
MEFEHYGDDRGNCKHCGKPIAFFHMKVKKGAQR